MSDFDTNGRVSRTAIYKVDKQAPAGRASRRAEAALQMVRPTNPVEAARKRASILADLNRDAPNDPRVQSVFDADPIVAEDPTNGNLRLRQPTRCSITMHR